MCPFLLNPDYCRRFHQTPATRVRISKTMKRMFQATKVRFFIVDERFTIAQKIEYFYDFSTEDDSFNPEKVTDSLIDFICSCNLPHVTVEMRGFTSLIRFLQPSYKLPSGDEVSMTLSIFFRGRH